MTNIYENGIIVIHRGDSFSTPLFTNAGTNQKPMRHELKDYLLVIENTTLAIGSIIKEDSIITEGSLINGELIEDNILLENNLLIVNETLLNQGSKLKVNSFIKEHSILNNLELLKDTNILEEEIYLGIMENNQIFENAIIKKKYNANSLKDDSGDIIIEINPEDTINILPGKYKYQIKAKLINKHNKPEVNTIVASRFVIEE